MCRITDYRRSEKEHSQASTQTAQGGHDFSEFQWPKPLSDSITLSTSIPCACVLCVHWAEFPTSPRKSVSVVSYKCCGENGARGPLQIEKCLPGKIKASKTWGVTRPRSPGAPGARRSPRPLPQATEAVRDGALLLTELWASCLRSSRAASSVSCHPLWGGVHTDSATFVLSHP